MRIEFENIVLRDMIESDIEDYVRWSIWLSALVFANMIYGAMGSAQTLCVPL